MLDKLRRDHEDLRAKGEVVRALLLSPSPPAPETLAHARWSLSSAVMQHLAFEDRHLYAKLLTDARPYVVALGKQFETELGQLFSRYSKHAQQWTPDRIAGQWDAYRRSALPMIDEMNDRMAREERELFVIVEQAEIETRSIKPPLHNWARDAFAIKDTIQAVL